MIASRQHAAGFRGEKDQPGWMRRSHKVTLAPEADLEPAVSPTAFLDETMSEDSSLGHRIVADLPGRSAREPLGARVSAILGADNKANERPDWVNLRSSDIFASSRLHANEQTSERGRRVSATSHPSSVDRRMSEMVRISRQRHALVLESLRSQLKN